MHVLKTIFVFICLMLSPGNIFAVSLQGTVVEVLDGDMLTIQTTGAQFFKVRLREIDAPEMPQTIGRQARQFTYDLVFAKQVTVEYETVDKYRRLIGIVRLPGGQVLNDELVRHGLAWHYRVHYPSHERLRELEYQAWRKNIGFWVEPAPIPPWQFRRDNTLEDPPENPSEVDYDRIFSYGLIGNLESKIYLWPACRNYPRQGKGFAVFSSKLEAKAQGFAVSPDCEGG